MSWSVETNREIIPELSTRQVFPRSAILWLAALYMAMFVIRPWERLFPELAAFRVERVYALMMIAIVTVTGQFTIRLDLPTIAVVLFTALIAATAPFAVDADIAWSSVYVYFTLLAFYFVLVSVIRSVHDLMFIATCYIVCMACYLAKSQWEYFFHGAAEYEMGVYRMQGIDTTYSDPNSVGLSILFSIPILLFLYTRRNEFCAAWPKFWRIWFSRGLVVYAMLAVSSVVLTRSRGALVSMVFAFFLWSLHGKNIPTMVTRVLGVMVLSAVGFLFLPGDVQERMSTLWNAESGPKSAEASVEGRRTGLLAGIQMVRDRPMFGVGPGNFKSYRIKHVDGVPLQAHNLLGQVLGETGLVGTAALAFLILSIFLSARKVHKLEMARGDPESLLAGFAVACRDVLILLLFSGLFGHTLQRFNWFWIASYCSAALFIARNLQYRYLETEFAGADAQGHLDG